MKKLILFGASLALALPGAALAGDAAAGKAKYDMFCSSCHGASGKGDGPAGAALNPKPRNFTDAAWQDKVDDAHIAKVIKEGGAAAGLSPLMPPWGASLSDDDVNNIVAYIRSLKGK
ncbi:MAG: cytochrome c [Candidatus Dadabacteria bacterium]|nr:MAG: cytochrome c [Candidatus Dadabacteria bacterium]